ncbi:unnamed protein product [Mytilus coruscus]|uniref:Integrase catalytic domain-containing protein n=1 Tax=Mytilus coruscus TaxID=42192 RepID=A0A6J8EWE3_MYTCO|nr:unnamed protein product [Mytilus coruscus]
MPPVKGYNYICNIVDCFSRLAFGDPLKGKFAKDVAELTLKYVYLYGPPRILQSDNGKEFTNVNLAEVVSIFKTRQIHGRPYHPQSQGRVERFNRTLTEYFRKEMSLEKDWPSKLPEFYYNYNNRERKFLAQAHLDVEVEEEIGEILPESNINENGNLEMLRNINDRDVTFEAIHTSGTVKHLNALATCANILACLRFCKGTSNSQYNRTSKSQEKETSSNKSFDSSSSDIHVSSVSDTPLVSCSTSSDSDTSISNSPVSTMNISADKETPPKSPFKSLVIETTLVNDATKALVDESLKPLASNTLKSPVKESTRLEVGEMLISTNKTTPSKVQSHQLMNQKIHQHRAYQHFEQEYLDSQETTQKQKLSIELLETLSKYLPEMKINKNGTGYIMVSREGDLQEFVDTIANTIYHKEFANMNLEQTLENLKDYLQFTDTELDKGILRAVLVQLFSVNALSKIEGSKFKQTLRRA